MPSQFDQAALRNRVRQRADMVNSEFVSDAELDDFNEASFQELYGIAVGDWEDVFVRSFETSIGPGAPVGAVVPSELDLPGDFKKLRGVRIKNDRFLCPVSIREIERLDSQGGAIRRLKPRYYWLYGNATAGLSRGFSVGLMPPPDTTYTIVVYYIPSLTLAELAADTSSSNTLAMLSDWDEYIVITSAMKCKDKEESDVSVLLTERGILLENIKKIWQPVDTSEAARVVQLNEKREAFNPYDYDPEDYFG